MIVVRVELHSAITGRVTELARMIIANQGGTKDRGEYTGKTLRGRSRDALDWAQRHGTPERSSEVSDYPRLSLHVWNLVARMLSGMGYR